MAQLNDLLVLGNTSLIGDVSLSSKLNIGNIIVQGSPSSDTTIANMNRFQTDLFVQGNGSAPTSPKVAGFYLGKSTSDENRHMDIVSGGNYAYIDFNKASVVEDYKVRLMANVTTGLTEFKWGSSATNAKLQINGALGVSSGLTVTGNASITNLLTVGSAATHYGIKVGDVYINAISGNLIFQNLGALRFGADSWDYNVWAGLKYDSSNKIIYLGLADNSIFTANSAQSGGNLSLPGIRYFTVNGKRVLDAGDAWLRINESSAFSSGTYFGTSLVRTDNQFQVGSGGTKFYANNSGNGYFSNTLGIAGTNTTYKLYVNGISYFSGTLSTRVNNPAINFRPDNATYYTTVSYQTAGNEALVFAAKNAITSFIFVNGEDSITNNASDRWYSLTPGLQIKNNCVAIGKLIASGTNPTYKLEVAGTSYFTGKMQVNAPIFGYNYTNSNNAAAFIWDKPGSNYTGMGANGASDTIYFGACTVDGTWVPSYKQKWVFNGAVSANTVAGAVWNDYAEYRESDCEDFGYVLCEKGDDSLTKTTERLSHFAGISSDTWGFSQGKTERATTPIAVAGRVLAYTYRNRNCYKPGDCVCAAPGGTVDIMTREEIINYPDRIVGTVSCIPEYEMWGGGEGADREPVAVNNRIWIKVK